MKHLCPKCGHRFDDNAQQSKAAKERWKATSAEDRSSAASAAAKARWSKKRPPAYTPDLENTVEHEEANIQSEPRPGDALTQSQPTKGNQ